MALCCPLRRAGDLLLAREGSEGSQQGGRRFGLLQRVEKEEGGPLTCRLSRWNSGEDVYNAFEEELRDFLPPSV